MGSVLLLQGCILPAPMISSPPSTEPQQGQEASPQPPEAAPASLSTPPTPEPKPETERPGSTAEPAADGATRLAKIRPLPAAIPPLSAEQNQEVQRTCERIAEKLASVSLDDCLALDLRPSGYYSRQKTPILIREFPPLPGRTPLGRVLLIGGVHGDELTSISSVFKWLHTLKRYHSGMFHWSTTPLLNPDGALRRKATRTNANGVDLNRNLPTPNWHRLSSNYWVKTTGRDPRRFPGDDPGSEPETQWLINEIEQFRPDVIVSVHAPHGIVDYDAQDRRVAPHRIGILYRDFLGTYPGSLGNYGGIHKRIPVVTLELPHAYVMPTPGQISRMWVDLVSWLRRNVANVRRARLGPEVDPLTGQGMGK